MSDNDTRLRLSPQVNISRSTAARMWVVLSCAFLAALQSALSDYGISMAVALAALIAAVLSELAVTYRAHGFGKIRDGSAAASALVLALLLPNHINPVYAAMGAAFAVVVVKHSFGGLGSNWMNPALGGWLFIRFSWPLSFAGALEGSHDYFSPVGSAAGQAISGFLNRTVFQFLSTVLPAGYIDLFASKPPGIIADRAVLVIILGVIFIAAFQISRSWLSILYLAVFGFLVRMLGDVSSGGVLWNGDVLLALFSGGTLVTAFILIADPTSGAKSAPGNAVLAILAAILGFAFRYWGDAFYGCFYAVALINAFTPLLCKAERFLLYSGSGGIIHRAFQGSRAFQGRRA